MPIVPKTSQEASLYFGFLGFGNIHIQRSGTNLSGRLLQLKDEEGNFGSEHSIEERNKLIPVKI